MMIDECYHQLDDGYCSYCGNCRVNGDGCDKCGSYDHITFRCEFCEEDFESYDAKYDICQEDITYDYELIREINAIKIQCIIEYRHHPKFVGEFLQDHDMEELHKFDEWMINRYVCE